MSTTTLKLDWDDATIEAVRLALNRELARAAATPHDDLLRQALADIEIYRSAVAAVKDPEDAATRRRADMAILTAAILVLDRYSWPGRSTVRALVTEMGSA